MPPDAAGSFRPWSLPAASLLALAGIAAGLILGAETLDPVQIGDLILRPDAPLSALVWQWRLLRVLSAFLVGACLAIAGVLFQGAFRNPLAEPYLLGTASGASLGASVALLAPSAMSQALSLPLFAFGGALAAILIVLIICRMARIRDAAGMLLVGVAAAAIIGAIRSLVTLLLSDESVSLRAVLSWTLGGVQTPTALELAGFALCTAICLVLAVGLARGLDILGLGESMAETMGLPVERFLALVVLIGAVATGLAVALGGVIGFVGLVAPHIVRWWVGESHRRLLIHAALFGGGMVALLDGISRAVIPPSEVPLGLITAILGGPFFLYLLIRRSR